MLGKANGREYVASVGECKLLCVPAEERIHQITKKQLKTKVVSEITCCLSRMFGHFVKKTQ